MDHKLHSAENRVVVLFVLLAACAASGTAQEYCGVRSVAHAVQVSFAADCGDDVPDHVSVREGSALGPLLPLMKAPSGYWEADRATFEATSLQLCAPDCSRANGCAKPSQILAIERGLRRVCASRYVIRCSERVWRIHVESGETGLGHWLLEYKSVKRTPYAEEETQRGGKRTPFDLCNLAYDEQVETELQLQITGRIVSIPLKPVHFGLFERGQTVNVSQEELVPKLKKALKLKRALTAEERKQLPELVTFRLIDR